MKNSCVPSRRLKNQPNCWGRIYPIKLKRTNPGKILSDKAPDGLIYRSKFSQTSTAMRNTHQSVETLISLQKIKKSTQHLGKNLSDKAQGGLIYRSKFSQTLKNK